MWGTVQIQNAARVLSRTAAQFIHLPAANQGSKLPAAPPALRKSRSFSSLPWAVGTSSQGPIQLRLEDIVNFNVFISFLLGLSPLPVMKVLFIIPYQFLTNGTRNLKPPSIIFQELSQPFKTKPPLFSHLI